MLVKHKFRGVRHTLTYRFWDLLTHAPFSAYMRKTVYVYITKYIYLYGIKVDENITIFIFPNIITILNKFALKPIGVHQRPSYPICNFFA